MYHRRFTADRWTLGAYSTLQFEDLKDAKEVALVQPGWGSNPRESEKILEELAAKGIFGIAVDTRYGYANQKPLRPHRRGSLMLRAMRQSRNPGSVNRYFPNATQNENQARLRRPTSVLAIADALGIEEFHAIGHSDGGRIMTEVADNSPDRVKSITVVNGVGTDPATHPGMTKRELVRSIKERRQVRRAHGPSPHADRVPKAGLDRVYHIGHPRRMVREATVISRANGWPVMSRLAKEDGMPINVIHARHDPALSFEYVQQHASERPEINFIPVEGGHSAYYLPHVAETIAETVASAANGHASRLEAGP